MYTKWKLENGIIDEQTANNLLNYAPKPTPQDMMNRRSVTNETNRQMLERHWNWINESLSDLSDLMLPNVTEWNIGHTTPENVFLSKNDSNHDISGEELDLVTIFKLYEATLELASRRMKWNTMENSVNKMIVENLISNQKQRLKDELSLLIEDEYFIIDRPYGVLVYSSGLDKHILVDDYLKNFYLRTIKDIVETIELTRKDFLEIGGIQPSIERQIFPSNSLRP